MSLLNRYLVILLSFTFLGQVAAATAAEDLFSKRLEEVRNKRLQEVRNQTSARQQTQEDPTDQESVSSDEDEDDYRIMEAQRAAQQARRAQLARENYTRPAFGTTPVSSTIRSNTDFVSRYMKEIDELFAELEAVPDILRKINKKFDELKDKIAEEAKQDEELSEPKREAKEKAQQEATERFEKALADEKKKLTEHPVVIFEKIKVAADKANDEARKTLIKLEASLILIQGDDEKKDKLEILELQKEEALKLMVGIKKLAAIAVKQAQEGELGIAIELTRQTLEEATMVSAKVDQVERDKIAKDKDSTSDKSRANFIETRLKSIDEEAKKIATSIKAKQELLADSQDKQKEAKEKLYEVQSLAAKEVLEGLEKLAKLAEKASEEKKFAEGDVYVKQADELVLALREKLLDLEKNSEFALKTNLANYKSKIESKDLTNSNLAGGDISETKFCSYTDFSGSNLKGTNAQKISMVRGKLIDVKAKGADFSRATLNYISSKSLDFSSTNLTQTKFIWAVLRDANFSGAICSKTDFKNADVQGVDFSGADLSEALNLDTTVGEVSFCPDADKLPKGIKCSCGQSPAFKRSHFDLGSDSLDPKNWG